MSGKIFKHKAVTILGGTGTLGQALVRHIRQELPDLAITIVSRDEHKQAAMRKHWPELEYVLGDIRRPETFKRAMKRKDVVFHVAALKHVDILEENPHEAYKTNVEGTLNAACLAEANNVPYFLFSSTDKAVDPINAYGYSKAMAEKILFDLNKKQVTTRFSVYRWGNVIGSQGSVIPTFVKMLREQRKVRVTDPEMTRFWLPIEWTTRFMLRTFPEAYLDRAMVLPMMKAAKVTQVIESLASIIGVTSYDIDVIGMRPGEKLHEVMYSQHDNLELSSDNAVEFEKRELIELLTPLVVGKCA